MSPALSKSLVDILLASGVSSRDEATALAANLNGSSWTADVLNSGKVDEQLFLKAIGEFFSVPVVSIDAKSIERATLLVLPSRFVFQHHILPIEIKDNAIVLATYDLFNSTGRQLASQLLDKPAEWVLVPRAQILRAMKTLYGVGAETFDEILKTNRSFEALQDIETSTDLNADDPEASVVKFVNQIIREAIHERATDIHVEPLENDLRIRYRIDGILHEVAVPPQLRLLQSAIISRLKVMAHMDIAERRLPQDGRINLQSAEQTIDVRVSTIPTVNGESISLRLLARDQQKAFGFERLDMSPMQTRIMKSLLAQPNGIVLVTGPDRLGQIDFALLFPQQHQFGPAPYHHDRRTGRISSPGRLTNRRETGDRPDVRERPPPHSAAGPERRHGRRNSRRGDGRYRDSCGHDRSPRLQHPAHERRRRRHHPIARHGSRAVPSLLGRESVSRPTTGPHHLP